jgi:hypothetical protein
LLRDNLTLWTAENEGEDKADDVIDMWFNEQIILTLI